MLEVYFVGMTSMSVCILSTALDAHRHQSHPAFCRGKKCLSSSWSVRPPLLLIGRDSFGLRSDLGNLSPFPFLPPLLLAGLFSCCLFFFFFCLSLRLSVCLSACLLFSFSLFFIFLSFIRYFLFFFFCVCVCVCVFSFCFLVYA